MEAGKCKGSILLFLYLGSLGCHLVVGFLVRGRFGRLFHGSFLPGLVFVFPYVVVVLVP